MKCTNENVLCSKRDIPTKTHTHTYIQTGRKYKNFMTNEPSDQPK